MEWLKENWFKIACLTVVLLIGLGYVNFLNNKESNRQAEEAQKQLQAKLESLQNQEVENKKYAADRKADCLSIYKTENDKWNNVRGWRYEEEDDKCYIRYKEQIPKTDAECEEIWTLNGDPVPSLYLQMAMCEEGEFENTF